MIQFNDPGADFWERGEQRNDSSMLVGYGSLGRSDSLDEKIDGKWHKSFNSVIREVSEESKSEEKKKSAPIQPITTILSAASIKDKVSRRSKRINTGQTLKIPQNPPKPIKPKKGTANDNQSDYGTGTIPKKLKKVKDRFDNI